MGGMVTDASVGGAGGSADASTRDSSTTNRDAASDAASDAGMLGNLALKLSPAQMLGVLTVANNGEIQQGTLAKTKAEAASVRQFATMMVKAHTQAGTEVTNTEQSLSLKPATSQLDTAMTKAGTIAMAVLNRTPKGAQFDRGYMELQVLEHQNVLEIIDAMRDSPNTSKLQTLLGQLRTAVEMHLVEAKNVLENLH
jgi:putative membrane protein